MVITRKHDSKAKGHRDRKVRVHMSRNKTGLYKYRSQVRKAKGHRYRHKTKVTGVEKKVRLEVTGVDTTLRIEVTGELQTRH